MPSSGSGHSLQARATHVLVKDSSNRKLPRDVSRRFGKRLRKLRCEKNYTLLRMMWDFGIDHEYLRNVEEGRECISLATLELIALALKLPLSQLLQEL